MSKIHGVGYGDKHDWKRGETEQSWCPERRSTEWSCQRCGVVFRHWYHITPDIFEAIKEQGVREECAKK